MINFAVEKHVLDAGIREAADPANDLATITFTLRNTSVHYVVGVQHLLAVIGWFTIRRDHGEVSEVRSGYISRVSLPLLDIETICALVGWQALLSQTKDFRPDPCDVIFLANSVLNWLRI